VDAITVDETRRWALRGIRAAAAGPRLILLSVLNMLLFVLAVVALVLVVVPGLGLVAFPAVVALVRRRTDLERRLAAGAGVEIARPYRPQPPRPGFAGWRRFRWTVTDSATWLDLAWLIPGAVTGLVLGLLALVVPLYGLQGVTLLPLWLYLGTDWYGYGVFWPMEDLGEAWLSGPQGWIILLVGLGAAPWLHWLHARFAKFFLAPTRSAELAQRVRQLTVTRADAVDAQAVELRRIERDLHDGAQARLVSLSMSIGLAEEMMQRDPAAARRLLTEAREASTAALVELRHLVRGIHPPVLAERGLDGAVRALALGLPVPVEVDMDLPGRPETPVESAAYFAVAEVLANVSRHSGARTCWVSLRYADGTLAMVVGDDGTGGADPTAGTGLRGIERRLAAFDGTMTLSSPPGGPTVVTMELPCALSSPKTLPSSGTA
jgi:signal transduction histidine kinase